MAKPSKKITPPRKAVEQLQAQSGVKLPPNTAPTHIEVASRLPRRRRAGFSFTDVAVVILALADLNDEQLAAIKADPMLATKEIVPEMLTGTLAGVADDQGNITALEDMPEEQLRKIGADMEIPDADTVPVTDLVAAIQAEQVKVPAAASAAATSASSSATAK